MFFSVVTKTLNFHKKKTVSRGELSKKAGLDSLEI